MSFSLAENLFSENKLHKDILYLLNVTQIRWYDASYSEVRTLDCENHEIVC